MESLTGLYETESTEKILVRVRADIASTPEFLIFWLIMFLFLDLLISFFCLITLLVTSLFLFSLNNTEAVVVFFWGLLYL